jgi:hypothetical protein
VDVQNETAAPAGRAPWWLRPPAAIALVALLVLFNRWSGGGFIVPLAVLVSALSIALLALALLSPRLRARWFERS